jgi:Holliday junction resolvasome RuvABC endonuclease subunit
MKILALDISSISSGYAVIDAGKITARGKIVPVDELQPVYGTKEKTKAAIDEQDILKVISNQASILISKHNIDRLVIENTWLGANPSVHQLLSRLSGGVLWEWLREGRPKALIISPTSARKQVGFLSGKLKGKELKEKLITFVNETWGVGTESDDEADAILLGMAGYKYWTEQTKSRKSHITRRWKR